MISFHVDGDPQGQPRPRARYKGPKGVYTPSGKAKQWARIVEIIAKQNRPSKPVAGAVSVLLAFAFLRPKSHYRKGRNIQLLRESARMQHVQKPDVDNLAKLVLDCLTRLRFWRDDSQVIELEIKKRWTQTTPGVTISVSER